MRETGRKLAPWLRKRLPPRSDTGRVRALLKELDLRTVCQEAHCPNIGECFARGTATFMIMGSVCTRNCTFCAVAGGVPGPLDPDEPARVAEAVRRMGLRHVVITSVTRDDLPDGGAEQFARTIRAVHESATANVEVLVPDFGGRLDDVDRVLEAGPEVFNHNVETVPRLYPEVRPQADYGRSLAVLAHAARRSPPAAVKSGLMLGLGETEDELAAVLTDLLDAGCRMLTLGQYLAPSEGHHPVVEFVAPERFDELKARALEMGFAAVGSGPFVRSSYQAEALAAAVLGRRGQKQGSTGGGQHGSRS